MNKFTEASKLDVTSVAVLQQWLRINHTKDTNIWLIIYNKIHPNYIGYDLLMDLLISHGWIDGMVKSLGADRHMTYISPRKRGSTWSHCNQKRANKLIDEKKMTPFGLQVIVTAKEVGSWDSHTSLSVDPLPEDLQQALAKNQTAAKNFATYTRTAKQYIIAELNRAKALETRKRRVAATVRHAEQNRRY